MADGASPIARSWIEYFLSDGHEVHLVSSRPAAPMAGLASLAVVPVAFSGLAGGVGKPAGGRQGRPWWRSAATIGLRAAVRHWLGPLTVARAGRRLRSIIQARRPELVHAMRIPFEAAMAAAAAPAAPLLVSTWGNDLTLHAPASPLMRRLTRLTLERADALHADCERDRRLAADWGFDMRHPSTVLPGNGGVRREIFHREPPGPAGHEGPTDQPKPPKPVSLAVHPELTDHLEHPELARLLGELAPETPLVLNPRGFRGYVRNDSFFRSVPRVLEQNGTARFACVAMAGEPQAERWIERLGVSRAVRLLPQLGRRDLAALMRRAQVMVSPSEHDGTPNTLLEAMACGAYPVLGRLESVAEWVEDGVNGALVDPAKPEELAAAILQALAAHDMRARAAEINQQLVADRADFGACMVQAEAFYRELVAGQ